MTKNAPLFIACIMGLAVATPALAQNTGIQNAPSANQRAAARNAYLSTHSGGYTTGTDESSGGMKGTGASGTPSGSGTGSEGG
jgi:hypothetical protein